MKSIKKQRIKGWQECRFGMFIHWGGYTLSNLGCWTMHDQGIPAGEYVRRFGRRFNPQKFDARAFARTARDAGCKYIVMCSRHHEGLCLWDTKTTRYSTVHMAPKRDFIAEYVKSARAAGLKVGLYYSLLDWRYQSYFDGPRKDPAGWRKLVRLVHEQVRELMTNYGHIDILWYDGGWPAVARDKTAWGYKPSEADLGRAWRSRQLNAMVHRLQPHILINNRSYPLSSGDFSTPEQQITPEHRPWELCDTMGHLWGASSRDRNRKTAREILTRLITCVSYSGNMLLNIGPAADGTVQPWQAAIMRKIGAWMARHGESIYGCEAMWSWPFQCALAPWKTTRRRNTIYLHLLFYPGRSFGIANLHDFHLKSATLLTTGKKLKITHEPTRDIIEGLPPRSPDPLIPVVKVAIRPKTASERIRRGCVGVGVEDPEKQIDY